MTLPPVRRVRWEKTYRIIRSIFPPIDLFEDIADPADWEAIASAEAKLNPRATPGHGDLSRVPVERRVAGPGASLAMAPFVHCSRHRPSRFSRGDYGLYYAGDREEVAIAETAHHHARTMAATNEAPGWTSQFRVLVGRIDVGLHGVAGVPDVLDPEDYSAAQELGERLRAAGSHGVVYPSVRHEGGACVGIFWPDIAGIPVQGTHYDYHWNGERVDFVRRLSQPPQVFSLKP